MRHFFFRVVVLLWLMSVLAASFKNQLVESEPSQNMLTVPFYYQDTQYYCGPASLEMVFDYYGPIIAQLPIADVARTDHYDWGDGTPVEDMIRAGHFSNMSTSVGNETSGSITGYSPRKLGYATFEQSSDYMTIDDLKALIDKGYPVILLMWFVPYTYGHYRVAVGYNDTHIFLHDPWNPAWSWTNGGPYLAFTYSSFLDLWTGEERLGWAMLTCPWEIAIEYPTGVHKNETFNIIANITYPCPSPFPADVYPASSVNATITLSPGLSLSLGESYTKPIGNLQAGESTTATWSVKAENFGNISVTVEAEGKITGSVPPNEIYDGYDYEDRIGGSGSSIIEVLGLIHDISVSNISSLKTSIGKGSQCRVATLIKNIGECTEASNVTVHFNETVVSMHTFSSLAPGKNATFSVVCSTNSLTYGNYTVTVYVANVLGETNTTDNTCVDGWIFVTVLGDVNSDKKVDITDISMTISAYGKTDKSPGWGSPTWYANKDVNDDKKVDITDISTVISQYGKKW